VRKIIKSNQAPAPIGPYSQAVLAGNMLFVSGQVAINPESGHFEDLDVASQASRVMSNLGAILHEAGFDWKHVVKSTIFLKDMYDFGTVNQVYGAFFEENPPARETVEVARLPKDAKVEISVVALK
jgi:2-iminobutanoate/2-iminopropanoate deaminase